MTLDDARKIGPLLAALDTIKPNNADFAIGLVGGKLPPEIENAMLRAGESYIRNQLRQLSVDA